MSIDVSSRLIAGIKVDDYLTLEEDKFYLFGKEIPDPDDLEELVKDLPLELFLCQEYLGIRISWIYEKLGFQGLGVLVKEEDITEMLAAANRAFKKLGATEDVAKLYHLVNVN